MVKGSFSSKVGNKKGGVLLPLLFNTVFNVHARAIRQEGKKGTQIGKEVVVLSIFADLV